MEQTAMLSLAGQMKKFRSMAAMKNLKIIMQYNGWSRKDENIVGMRIIAPSNLRASHSIEYVQAWIADNGLSWVVAPDTGASFNVRFGTDNDEAKQMISNQFKQIASIYDDMIATCEAYMEKASKANDSAEYDFWDVMKGKCKYNRNESIVSSKF